MLLPVTPVPETFTVRRDMVPVNDRCPSHDVAPCKVSAPLNSRTYAGRAAVPLDKGLIVAGITHVSVPF
jgi:hypothetical protein